MYDVITKNEEAVLKKLFLSNNSANILKDVENAYKSLNGESLAAHILSFIKNLLENKDKEAFQERKEIEKKWADNQLTICCRIIFNCYKYNHKNLAKSLEDAKDLVASLDWDQFEDSLELSFQNYSVALSQWVELANRDIRSFDVEPFWKIFTEAVFDYSKEYQEEQARKLTKKKAEEAKIAEQKRIAEEKKKAEVARLAEEKRRIEFEKYEKEEKKKCVPKFIIIAFIIPLIVLESVTFGLDCLVQTYIMKSFWGIWPYVVIFVLGCIVGALGVKNMVQEHVNYYNNHIRLFIYEMLIPHIFLVLFLVFETMIMGLGYCFERFCLNTIWAEIVLIILSVICIIIGIYKRDDYWDSDFFGYVELFLLIPLGAFFIIEIALFNFVGVQWYWIVGFVSLSIISIVVSYRLFIEYIEDGWLFNYIIDLKR